MNELKRYAEIGIYETIKKEMLEMLNMYETTKEFSPMQLEKLSRYGQLLDAINEKERTK